eukprot:6173739-Pleurochrysis_carterae.AAC.7
MTHPIRNSKASKSAAMPFTHSRCLAVAMVSAAGASSNCADSAALVASPSSTSLAAFVPTYRGACATCLAYLTPQW